VRQHSRAQGRAMKPAILVQEFSLNPRHIDACGALTFASLAFQAQVEHWVQRWIGEADWSELAGNCQPERIRPAAGGVLFLARRHIRRTHRAGKRFSASTDSAALLRGLR